MTYPRNAASPEPIAIGAVVQISDGAVQASGCTVRIKPIGVAEGDGGGTTAYSTDGVVYYTPTQAETNYTSFILIAKKTGCIPVAVTVVTSASATAGYVGTDQGKIANATSTVNLSGTTVKAVTDRVTANVDQLGGDAQSATDLKDFADAGYDPSTNKVQGVVLVDDVTAKTGYSLANASIAAATFASDAITASALAADAVTEIQSGLATAVNLATVAGYLDTEIAAILADTNELQTDWADGGRLDLILDARASQTSVDDLPTVAEFEARTIVSANYSTLTQAQVTGGAYPLTSASFAFNAALDFTAAQKAATLARVTLTDTVTTYTGDTPQTGDSYAVVASALHGNAELKAETALILANTNELQTDWADGGRLDVILDSAAVKTGYSLSAAGLDSVLIESGISAGASLTNDTGTQITAVNARQAIAAILSAGAGVLSGVSANTPAFKPGGKASGNTRISATVTSDGRTAVTLKVPD